MAQPYCLAGVAPELTELYTSVFRALGAKVAPTIASLDVRELRVIAPLVLVCDVDDLSTDRLELIRQIRFVCPESLIAILTSVKKHTWALACHLAGANALLVKGTSESDIIAGLRDAQFSGCFTDPAFAA